jgi:hypothetical protein
MVDLDGRILCIKFRFGSEKKLSFTESAEASRSPGPPDYKIKAMVPNPPSYMRVSDKLQFKPNTTS